MRQLQNLFRATLAALFAALACMTGLEAQAQTIVNTAQARWIQSGEQLQATSNTVQFTVSPLPVTIEALHPVAGSATYPALSPTQCGGAALPGTAGANGAAASLGPASSLRIGETLFLRISAPAQNRDPGAIESITVDIASGSGDREQITIFETGPDTGLFVGGIPTSRLPATPQQFDCRLTVHGGETVTAQYNAGSSQNSVAVSVVILADPFGLVFDSEDGSAVDGATVSIVDAATGAPAVVFADDGVTRWPSTVISGQPVTDTAGNVYPMASGEYRFPLAPLGSYRIVVTPPAPYSAPSTVTPGQIAGLLRPDGTPMQILPASYGQSFSLVSPAPVRVDIPVDRPSLAVGVSKTASRREAAPGDPILYTIHVTNTDPSRAKRGVVVADTPSQWLRIRPDTVRIDGQPTSTAVTIANDGRSLSIRLGDIAGGATRTVTYAAAVRPDAPPGQAENRAEAVDVRGNRAVASASVRINREVIAGRMTLIGRIVDGGCAVDAPHRGIPGVRVMLEDGSFAITDADGRYHFEGLVPGTHVVQAASQTLPAGGNFVECAGSTRNAGSASSRFIIGQGGSLAVADFFAVLPASAGHQTLLAPPVAAEATDRAAAGGETDWASVGDGPTDFLFPAIDHNPRAPAVRVVIRHRKDQTVTLFADGKAVDSIAFDGMRVAPQGYAISIWRGIPLSHETTRLTATVRGPDGTVSSELRRDVHFAATPARFELVPARSRLVADGATRPVIAVRILDRSGRPVHAGLTGSFALDQPYESAAQLDALQSRQLSGLDRAAPTWLVKGDDGVALIELAPTLVSGALRMDFSFTDGTVTRRQTLEGWIVPGDQKWTLVGLAEGTVGARSVADNMERKGSFDSDLGNDARVAFYAKGRVLGKYLLTLAYDSAKQKDDQRLLGAIDPNAYYTVFADGSDRRFDAASREKLYVRIEGRTFYALYGDFSTGFDNSVLARYVRNLTGVKGEGQFGGLRLQGFAARSGSLHRRDEIQGAGISGPYRLSDRSPIPNSETVTIEVRDRFHSEVVIEKQTLTRYIDYDIDLVSGTISFREPILSRDTLLNPRFIVVEYDVEQATGGEINAGLRAEITNRSGSLRIGASVLTDTGSASGERTDLAAVDLRGRIGSGTEVRAEAAVSRTLGQTSEAWLVELEHHDGNLDMLGYIRSVAEGFGMNQMSGAERGRRKIGVDGRYRFSDALALNFSTWQDDSLTDDARRQAIEVAGTYRTANTEARIGIATFTDRLRDGTRASSTVAEGALTRRFLDNRLEVSASAQVALGRSDSVDLPSRYRIGLGYAVTPSIKLKANYEIAIGDAIRARMAQFGVEVSPWAGARVLGSLGRQDVAEYGKRSFATFGLTQSLPLTKDLTIDATLDSARTLNGFDASKIINPAHPVASGGLFGESGSLAEDFTAVTLGATWRHDRWTATTRVEYRDGQLANRKGASFGLIRQLGSGRAFGAGFTWTSAKAGNGAASEVFDGAISAAYRPENSEFSALYKFEYRSDAVSGAVIGEAGPAGRSALTVDGDASSRRVIGSISTNWQLTGRADGERRQKDEIGVFGAIRHSFDTYGDFDLKGTTLLGGLDLHFSLNPKIEVGAVATVRHGTVDGTTSFSVGPQLGFVPVDNVLLTVGYNLTGFRDRDFGASRNTMQGIYAAVRVKLDADLLGALGLGR